MEDFGSQQFPPLPGKLRCPGTSIFGEGASSFSASDQRLQQGWQCESHEVQFGDETAGEKRILRSPGNMQKAIFKKLALKG